MRKRNGKKFWLSLVAWIIKVIDLNGTHRRKNPQPQKINEHKGLESDLWAVLTMNKDQNTLCWCNSFKIIKIVATLSPHYKKGRKKKKKLSQPKAHFLFVLRWITFLQNYHQFMDYIYIYCSTLHLINLIL